MWAGIIGDHLIGLCTLPAKLTGPRPAISPQAFISIAGGYFIAQTTTDVVFSAMVLLHISVWL
jgi:hypothetical protein